MSQCDLHFGDPTAHATVEWFLRDLTEEKSLPSEELCKALNVARFIDCLCQQVEEKDLFKPIEYIAKDFEGENWKGRPHLSVLLFSIARNSLMNQFKNAPEFVKTTSLYRVAEEIYNHFKAHPDSYESCSHVFKTGFQLAYFQEDNQWHREYAKFKALYYKELSELRLHYHSVDNPTELARRAVARWKRISSVAPEFEALEEAFHELNPMRLELPILARSTEALRFASDFVQNLETGKIDNEGLAKEFRIIQWEVLVRNLVEEDMRGKLCFHPITSDYNIPGTPDEEFLIDFINKAREVERGFIPSDEEIPTKKRDDDDSLSTAKSFFDSTDLDSEVVRKCLESFKSLLPKAPEYHPSVHEDLVRSFANMRGTGESLNSVLIEDGELSFFSLLWLLRHVAGQGKQPKDWKSKPDEKLPVCFRPNDDSPSEADWWDSRNMPQFAVECGLIIPLSKAHCVPTRRWRSLIAWLRRLNDNLKSPPQDNKKHLQPKELDEKLPVKRLNYGEKETSFVKKLWEFFASDRLREVLDDLEVFLPSTSMSCEAFAVKNLGCLVESLDDYSLLKVDASAGLKDVVLLRCCRAGFILLEHLFRAYQPHDLHLLIQALNWEESSLEGWNQAPISLGFATIAGRVETDQNVASDSKRSQASTDFDYWLVPYRSLFSALSADITLPVVQDSSSLLGERIGSREQQIYFAHQTSGLLDTIWIDPKRSELDFPSEFALWLARIHTTEIWGSFPIDTEAIIDFRNWWVLSREQIVENLVNLGLRGGIIRAAKPPKDGGGAEDPAWRLTYYAGELSSGDAEQILTQVRSSLSFDSPEDTHLPDWVTTKAFAICFYHAMRQATYHALETFILIDNKQKRAPCLWIDWDDRSVSIYNRGAVKEEHSRGNFVPNDRKFFDIFLAKTDEFCRRRNIEEKFKIDGPQPASTLNETWQLAIRKE